MVPHEPKSARNCEDSLTNPCLRQNPTIEQSWVFTNALSRKPRSDPDSEESAFRERCRSLLSTATSFRHARPRQPTVAQLRRAIETLCRPSAEKIPRKYVSDVVDGFHRPEPLKAWRIGQGLQHCGASAWTGIAMLYVAGWYADYVGVAVHLARQSRSDSSAHHAAAEYIRTLPVRFGSFLAEQRAEAWHLPGDTEGDDLPIFAELQNNALLARWTCEIELDAARLQTAWDHWQVSRDTQSPLATRARAIAHSKERLALREREAEAYLRFVFDNPQSLDEQLSARL